MQEVTQCVQHKQGESVPAWDLPEAGGQAGIGCHVGPRGRWRSQGVRVCAGPGSYGQAISCCVTSISVEQHKKIRTVFRCFILVVSAGGPRRGNLCCLWSSSVPHRVVGARHSDLAVGSAHTKFMVFFFKTYIGNRRDVTVKE